MIIINRAMAMRYRPGEDVLGKRITFKDEPKSDNDWQAIVGMVADVKDQHSSTSAEPAFW